MSFGHKTGINGKKKPQGVYLRLKYLVRVIKTFEKSKLSSKNCTYFSTLKTEIGYF